MKSQWIIVCGLGLALLTAIVAVFNTDYVELNYIAGKVDVSLIIVISSSILIGGLIVTVFGGMVRPYQLKKENDRLSSLSNELQTENEDLKLRLTEAQAAYSMSKKEHVEVITTNTNDDNLHTNGIIEIEKRRIL